MQTLKNILTNPKFLSFLKYALAYAAGAYGGPMAQETAAELIQLLFG